MVEIHHDNNQVENLMPEVFTNYSMLENTMFV
jgi:hypothetical protein